MSSSTIQFPVYQSVEWKAPASLLDYNHSKSPLSVILLCSHPQESVVWAVSSLQHTSLPQEAVEGRMTHNNGWNGVTGMVSNTWEPCVWWVWYFIYSVPTMSPSSPIKVTPTSCEVHKGPSPEPALKQVHWTLPSQWPSAMEHNLNKTTTWEQYNVSSEFSTL